MRFRGSLFLAIVILLCSGLSATTDTLKYTAPEFLQPFYDQYSTNYLNVIALGRGHTGSAATGNIETALINPAGFKAKYFTTYLEMFTKYETDDMNSMDDSYAKLKSSLPLGCIAAGFAVNPDISLGFIFSVPQSITYETFSRTSKAGDLIRRKPELINYQYTFAVAKGFGNFRFGLNTILNSYHQEDYRNYYSWDKINTTDNVLRFQAGALYTSSTFSVGATFKNSAEYDFDMTLNEKYTVEFPAKITVGTKIKLKGLRIFTDFEYEKFSDQSDLYEDRSVFKIGLEKDTKIAILRAGLFNSPEIFSGNYFIPEKLFENENEQNELYEPETTWGKIKTNEQMFITLGATKKLRLADLHIAYCGDVNGDFDVHQIHFAASIKMAKLGRLLKSLN